MVWVAVFHDNTVAGVFSDRAAAMNYFKDHRRVQIVNLIESEQLVEGPVLFKSGLETYVRITPHAIRSQPCADLSSKKSKKD